MSKRDRAFTAASEAYGNILQECATIVEAARKAAYLAALEVLQDRRDGSSGLSVNMCEAHEIADAINSSYSPVPKQAVKHRQAKRA